jgi:hypothetical protein
VLPRSTAKPVLLIEHGVVGAAETTPPESLNMAMSRILLKLAERSLPSMLLRDFQLFVKNSVMQLV